MTESFVWRVWAERTTAGSSVGCFLYELSPKEASKRPAGNKKRRVACFIFNFITYSGYTRNLVLTKTDRLLLFISSLTEGLKRFFVGYFITFLFSTEISEPSASITEEGIFSFKKLNSLP